MFNKLVSNLTGKKNVNEKLQQHSEEMSEDSHDTSDNGGTNSEEENKKKRISMLIRVIIVLALAYLAITEFVLKDEKNEVPAVAAKSHKPKKKDAPQAEQAAPAETKTVANQQPEIKTPEPVPPSTELKKEEVTPEIKVVEKSPGPPQVQPPVENINIADKKIEQPILATPNTPAAPNEQIGQVGEIKNNESQIDKNIDSLIEHADKKEKAESEEAKNKLEDKIVVEESYTPPPAYDHLGRGLVYNCKEKFWACVDKISYVNCNKNMKFNKSHAKAIECAVQNVYNSDEDCGVVQKYNVSINKTTEFCQ